jgi:hypothetical protein
MSGMLINPFGNFGASGQGVPTGLLKVASAIPEMTSATAPSGEVTVSSYHSSFPDFWKGFVHSFINTLDCWHADGGVPEWIKYDAGVGETIVATGYSITPRVGNTNQPTAWIFEGSDNDSDWDLLDTQTGVTAGWVNYQERVFELSSEVTYRYYRLNVSASEDSYVAIGRLTIGKVGPIVSQHMTSYSIPVPATISTSSENPSDGYECWNAFGEFVEDTGWVSDGAEPTPTVGDPEWVKFDAGVGNAYKVTSYYFTARQKYDYTNAEDFTLQGSNNDSAWDTLDTQTGLQLVSFKFSPTYEITTPALYRYYRLHVTKAYNGGSPTFVFLSQLDLICVP